MQCSLRIVRCQSVMGILENILINIGFWPPEAEWSFFGQSKDCLYIRLNVCQRLQYAKSAALRLLPLDCSCGTENLIQWIAPWPAYSVGASKMNIWVDNLTNVLWYFHI